MPSNIVQRLAERPLPLRRSRLPRALHRQTAGASARIRAAAQVTEVALAYTAQLSALEARYIHMAPLGEARYQTLIDAFTLAAGEEIRGMSCL